MDARLAADLTGLPDLLTAARDYAAEVLDGLPSRPAAAPVPDFAPTPLPAGGAGAAGALQLFRQRWAPGFSGSAGPRYLGFVTGGATPAALVGDWLTGTFDQNAVTRQDSSAVDLERETVGWLRSLFGLGDAHTGTFVTGATMSNTVGLAIGREWLGERLGVDVARQGVAALGDVVVLSGAPHSSVYKALSMLGIGRDRLRTVPLLAGREAVDPAALEAALAALGGRPAIVVANAGTVNTVDFDDLRAIAALRERHPFWLHVDAAFGAFAALSREHAHLVAGLDLADSVCVDLHKWLNVPYDAAVQFTRRRDLQVAVFQNSAAYLTAPAGDPDLFHLTPENSRRLRALAAWFALAAYGAAGHREIVTRNIAAAHRLGERLAAVPGVRLLSPVRLNVVCFTVDRDVPALLDAVARSGAAFLTPTVHHGVPAVRAAFANWRTRESDADRVADLLSELLT
ncbi:pyridoxal phosphate-dependent decarboxylase family protein [Actinoplanes teichomyceticus]|uniref:Glutamate/tyrosine decarboxylase-like PLP-dependent enzyme n=1 Tax=Actinoplanes teichomyceticus TaxID=1867 RepID=A0A561WAY9_ACTTI|nr:pyridoxal-dependent decarboxylase [Actinoplanes teichomyceticus]TWG21030.1 glutamate/tyrosine decarboxylase-like PLP-dependent enzyme [Actinoplanes teichomyceticus]GIF14850.1 aspartate aminotransferase family protein [Actinoplanes teichomyceticus]